jgi:hypothetical protein
MSCACQDKGQRVAPREVIVERREKCRPCFHRTNAGAPMTSLDRCLLCDCPIPALTKRPEPSCKGGFWVR